MYSKDGYKRNSKDKNNPYNIIPSGNITMKDVDFPVMGTDNLGNSQMMMPGADYTFPGNEVLEVPLQHFPRHFQKKEYGGEGGRTTALRNRMYDEKRNKPFAQDGYESGDYLKELPKLNIMPNDAGPANYNPHPLRNQINITEWDIADGVTLPHEMYHFKQRHSGEMFENPYVQRHPVGPVTDDVLYEAYNRRQKDHDRQTQAEFNRFPESQIVSDFTRKIVANAQMYENPETAEGEAKHFESKFMNHPKYLQDERELLLDDYRKKLFSREKLHYQYGGNTPQLPSDNTDNYLSLTDQEKIRLNEYIQNLETIENEKNNLGTYYMLEDGDGTVFYESKNKDAEDITFTSPEEYNRHRQGVGLPKDWTLIEKRPSNILDNSQLQKNLNAIDTDGDLIDNETIKKDLENRMKEFKTQDTTTRVDNISVPLSVDTTIQQIQHAINNESKSLIPNYEKYDHQLKNINKEQIEKELNYNVEKNNIKKLKKEEEKIFNAIKTKYNDKYLSTDYDLATKDEVTDIQEMLVSKGYNVGKYKWGERAGEDMVDGKWGPLTNAAYMKYHDDNLNKIISEKKMGVISGEHDFSSLLERKQCTEYGCAAGMFNLYADVVGWDAVRNAGMVGDAWTILDNMKNRGAYVKYNIYDSMKKPSSESELHSLTNQALNENPLVDFSMLEQGDVVGIYFPRSTNHGSALNEGKGTWNSHVGMISGFDEDGMPIVTHNIHGDLEHDRADDVRDTWGVANMDIAWVVDPLQGTGFKYEQVNKESKDWVDYSNENDIYINFLQSKRYDHKRKYELGEIIDDEDYFNSEQRSHLNDVINHVKNNTSKIVDELEIPIDEKRLIETVLSIGNVETGLGLHTPNEDDNTETLKIKQLLNTYIKMGIGLAGPLEQDLNNDGVISTDEKVQLYDLQQQDLSKGIGKIKLNKLDNFTSSYFDLDELTIDNYENSLNVMIASTAKAKYLLDRYSDQNPKLGLTEDDRWNMAVLTHNQGDEILLHFGSNENYTLDQQIKRLRNLYEGNVPDLSATDYNHLYELSVGDTNNRWQQKAVDAYSREQVAKYVKNNTDIYDALPNRLKKKVDKAAKGGKHSSWSNIRKGIDDFEKELLPYFENRSEWDYALGHESYISKVNRYITRSGKPFSYDDVYYTREGNMTRKDMIEEMAVRGIVSFEEIANGLDPAMEDYLIGQYHSVGLHDDREIYQKGGSVTVPTEKEAEGNPRYDKDMDKDEIPVGIDIDDSIKVPKDIMLLQSMKESSLNPKKISDKGAKGLTQIRPGTLKDYIKSTGDKNVDVFDWEDSMKIQDWYMNDLYSRPWIDKQNQTQNVRLAKTLAAYNWGPKNFNKFINKKKADGIDIYDDEMLWVKDLPSETKKYIETILLRQNEKFEGWVKDWNEDKSKQIYIDAYKEYKKGGSLVFPEWKRIKKHWKNYLSGKSINRDMYNKLVAYGFINKKKYKKNKRKKRSLKNVSPNVILNSINLKK